MLDRSPLAEKGWRQAGLKQGGWEGAKRRDPARLAWFRG